MTTNPLKNHLVFLQRHALNEQLLVRNDGQATPLGDFIEKLETIEASKVRIIQVGFVNQDATQVDLIDAFSLMSATALRHSAWEANYYMPVLSIGVMDRKGKIYPNHLVTRLNADMVNWLDDGRSFTLSTYLTAAVSEQLPKLLDPEKLDTRTPLYPPSSTPVAINLSGMYLLAGNPGVYPVLYIHLYVILDELYPAVHGDNHEAALKAQETTDTPVKAMITEPITTEEYRVLHANPDMSKTNSVISVLSLLTYGSLVENWAEHLLKAIAPTEQASS